MKKQMGERALLRGPNTFLTQRHLKHKSAKRPHEVPGSKLSQGSGLRSGVPCCANAEAVGKEVQRQWDHSSYSRVTPDEANVEIYWAEGESQILHARESTKSP